LAQARVRGYSLPAAEQSRFSNLSSQMDAIHSRWRVAWEQKAARGYRSRLNLWRDFLDEYRANPSEHADRYRYEVRLRVMLQLLAKDAHPLAKAELDLLAHLDQILRSQLVSGQFIWDAELQKHFCRALLASLWHLPKELFFSRA
jgi:DNA-binding PucR family transcriptional regulator